MRLQSTFWNSKAVENNSRITYSFENILLKMSNQGVFSRNFSLSINNSTTQASNRKAMNNYYIMNSKISIKAEMFEKLEKRCENLE